MSRYMSKEKLEAKLAIGSIWVCSPKSKFRTVIRAYPINVNSNCMISRYDHIMIVKRSYEPGIKYDKLEVKALYKEQLVTMWFHSFNNFAQIFKEVKCSTHT